MAGGSTGPWFRGLFHPTQTRIRVSNGEAATCRSACACIHTRVSGGRVERGHTLPFTCFLLPGVRAGRPEWPGMAAAGRGAAATASPPLVSFPPQTLGLPPLPCPLSPVSHPSSTAASLPRSPPSSLCAHPVSPAFFVTSFGPPSPVLWRPRVSLAAALWGPSCVLRGAPGRAAPWLPLLAPLCPGDGAGRRLLSLGECAVRGGGAERGLRGLDPQQMSDSWSVCRSSRASRPGMRQSSFG